MAPGLRLSFWNPRLLRTMFLQLQQQQHAGLFCDVTLQGDGEALHVHSCVIAACSPYLAQLLRCPGETPGGFDPTRSVLFNRRVLSIHEISSHYLLPLVHYMYTSQLEVAPADVYGVLKAAQKLRIPELEILKLEGGRLVRPESGRRLNRDCLGSNKHSQYVPYNQSRLVTQEMHAQKENYPFSQGAPEMEPGSQGAPEMEPSSQGAPEMEPGSQGAPEMEPSSQGAPEMEPGRQGVPEMKPGRQGVPEMEPCSQGAPEMEPRSQGAPESIIEKGMPVRPNDSSSTSHYCNTSDEKNRGSPRILPGQERELVAGEKQRNSDLKSKKGLLKRIRLDSVRKQAISPDTEISKPTGPVTDSYKINRSTLPKFEKYKCVNSNNSCMVKGSKDPELSNLQCDVAHLHQVRVHNDLQFADQFRELPDKTASEEHAGHLGGLVDCGSESEKVKALHQKEGADIAPCIKCAMTDPMVNAENVSYSMAYMGLEGVREDWSDLVTEMQNETVNQKGLASVANCKPETGLINVHDKNMNESPGSEVEKVKLRKASNGLSWEVVREDEPLHIESSGERDQHLNELEQLLEQILNVPSAMSPVVDVGRYSPVVLIGGGVWPDISSDSDMEVDVLG